MTERPVWRKPYDAAERVVGPRADAALLSEQFVAAAATVNAFRRLVGHGVNAIGARVWHSVNLPAGTDVQRLRQQVGALDREVRRLSLQLEQRQQDAPPGRRQAG